MTVSEYHARSVSVGDLVKRKCIRPEYGMIIDLKPIKGGTMTHRKLTVLWDDGAHAIAWPQDIEVISEGR